MRDAGWVAAACLAIVGCGGGNEELPSSLAVAPTCEQIYENGHPLACASSDPVVLSREDELTALTNEYRISLGMDALVDDPALRKLARAHCEHMILHGFFAHVNPEGDWPWDRATLAGIEWADFAENLAAGQETARQAFWQLLSSPEHRRTIEDSAWTHLGCGYAKDATAPYVHYWAQNFKRSKTESR